MARKDRENARIHFYKALKNDFEKGEASTTAEGVHLGSLAGALDIIQRGFTGLVIRDDVLWLDPLLPDELIKFDFGLQYRGCLLQLSFNHQEWSVFFERGLQSNISIGYKSNVFQLSTGDKKTFTMDVK